MHPFLERMCKCMAKPKKMPSGKWRVRVYDYTDSDNKKHYRSFTAPTRKEVQFLANEYLLNKDSDTYEDMTLKEAYKRYINSKSAVLSPSTIRGYISVSKNSFPKLMNTKLSKLTQYDIQVAVNEISVSFSPKTVRIRYGLLTAVLNMYRPQLRLHTTLPKPQKPKKEYIIPTTAEVNMLLAKADERIRVPILLASAGSLRRSEVCALTKEDITDFGVYINKAMVINSQNKYIVKYTTKTKAGTRFVPLPTSIVKELREWKYFGCTPKDIQRWFKKLRDEVGINTTFHKLRHYFASECHANGIPDKYICEIGGWEDVAVLQQIYQHTLKDKQSEFSKKIVTLFNSNLENNKKYDPKYDSKKKKAH